MVWNALADDLQDLVQSTVLFCYWKLLFTNCQM